MRQRTGYHLLRFGTRLLIECWIASWNKWEQTSVKLESKWKISPRWWIENEICMTLRPRQNDRHFPDIFKCIFLNENVYILIKISLKFVPKSPIKHIPALVQVMAWRRPGAKPLSEPMAVSLPTHICVTHVSSDMKAVDMTAFPCQWFIQNHCLSRSNIFYWYICEFETTRRNYIARFLFFKHVFCNNCSHPQRSVLKNKPCEVAFDTKTCFSQKVRFILINVKVVCNIRHGFTEQ